MPKHQTDRQAGPTRVGRAEAYPRLVMEFGEDGFFLVNEDCRTPENTFAIDDVLAAVAASFKGLKAGDRLEIELIPSKRKSKSSDILNTFENFVGENWEKLLGSPGVAVLAKDEFVKKLSVVYKPATAAVPGKLSDEDLYIIDYGKDRGQPPAEVLRLPPPEPPSSQQTTADAEQQLTAVVERIDAFRAEATPKLQDAINAYLGERAKAQGPGSSVGRRNTDDRLGYAEKEKIADTVNSNLERLGLAIGYRGHACNFAVTGGAKNGRFLLVPKGSKTPLLTRVNLSDFLPLTLVDASPRREGLVDWQKQEQARRIAAAQPATGRE